MLIADSWRYTGADPCARFFTLSLQDVRPPVQDDCTTLELGCAEFDWLRVARACWPKMDLTGIDWRPESKADVPFKRVTGDMMWPAAFRNDTYDLIVSISAIEHVGLGHYGKPRDPVNPDGDIIAMENAYDWLKPGGYCYVDVPWKPGQNQYMVAGTSHRVYDREALRQRFWMRRPWRVLATTITDKKISGLLREPVPAMPPDGESFYYFGMWLQKPE